MYATSLLNDLGEILDSAAHLTHLCRVSQVNLDALTKPGSTILYLIILNVASFTVLVATVSVSCAK